MAEQKNEKTGGEQAPRHPTPATILDERRESRSYLRLACALCEDDMTQEHIVVAAMRLTRLIGDANHPDGKTSDFVWGQLAKEGK